MQQQAATERLVASVAKSITAPLVKDVVLQEFRVPFTAPSCLKEFTMYWSLLTKSLYECSLSDVSGRTAQLQPMTVNTTHCIPFSGIRAASDRSL